MADYKRKMRYQKIATGQILAAGQKIIFPTANTDQLYAYVTGMFATISGDELGFQGSTFGKFEIDGQEVFGIGFEAKLVAALMGTDVKPNDKIYEFVDSIGRLIPFPAANSPVNIEYTDGSTVGVAVPYTINIWLRLENIDEIEMATAERMAAWLVKNFAAQDNRPPTPNTTIKA